MKTLFKHLTLAIIALLFMSAVLYAKPHHAQNENDNKTIEGIEAIFFDVEAVVLYMSDASSDSVALDRKNDWQPRSCVRFMKRCENGANNHRCKKLERKCEREASGLVFLEVNEEVNLLEFQNELAEFLGEYYLLAADYKKISLLGNCNKFLTMIIDGKEEDLKAPHVCNRGLVLKQDFSVDENNTAEFEMDFSIEKSVKVDKKGRYHLIPKIELVEKQEAPEEPVPEPSIYGSISGIVIPEGTVVFVFLFDNGGYDPASIDPLGTAITAVQPDENSEFVFVELLPGTYEIVVMNFTNSHVYNIKDIVVEANQTSDVGVIDVGSN